MKQPIIAAMRTLTSACILSVLLWQTSSASEHTTPDDQPEAIIYNPEATAELQKLFDSPHCYTHDLLRLVKKEHANPNINKHNSDWSLLYHATELNDPRFVALLLARGANPNPPGDRKPIFYARSIAIAELLVKAKADIHAQGSYTENVLHNAVMHNASAELITFWCNAGVNLHLKDSYDTTPLQKLLTGNNTTGDRMAPFLWAETNFTTEDKEDTVEKLTKRSPTLVPSFKALTMIVPQVKAEKIEHYEQQTRALLTNHLNRDIMPLVMSYAVQLPGHLYDVRYFKQDIEPRMLTMLAAEKASSKNSKQSNVAPKAHS